MSDERGSGSILVVAVISAVLGITALTMPLWGVLIVKNQLASAADSSALAAADVAAGRAPGDPCQMAAVIAEANGASVAGCRVDGLVVTVLVERSVLGFAMTAAATAGPPHEADPARTHGR